MPVGTYRVLDGDGGDTGEVERFRSAPGPVGWRYVSEIDSLEPAPHTETVDLAVDAAWRPVRVRIETGEHSLIARPGIDRIALRVDSEDVELRWDSETEVDYRSPAFNVMTVNRLAQAGIDAAELSVVFVEPFTCAPRIVKQRYESLGPEPVATPVGAFDAHAWRYTSLDTGWSRTLWVSHDTLVAFDRFFELIEYEAGASGPVPS